jgi:hypothetical protein
MAGDRSRSAIQDGLDVLAALRARGIRISLRADGAPAAGPRELLELDDHVLLREHRDLVIAALGYELGANGDERRTC